MTTTTQEIEILMLDSALNSAMDYERRCIRRVKMAQDEAHQAAQAVIKLANQLEAARANFLRRTA